MAANRKIKIGISACLLGNNVRYDGGNKLDQSLIDAFGESVEWVPICPEVGAGLPVPREPMQLIADGRKVRCVTIETKQDLTDIIANRAAERLTGLEQEDIRGFVFKARSPSCAMRDAPIARPSDVIPGAGIFARALMRRYPLLPVADEEYLRDASFRERFMAKVLAYTGL